MEIYHAKPKIKLSPVVKNGKEFVEVTFGNDNDIRLSLSKEERVYTSYFRDFQQHFKGRKIETVTPGDINESRSLIRVRQGKGKKDRYTLLSKPLMKKQKEYNKLYKPRIWLFERRPEEPFTESIVSKRLKAAARKAGITKRIYPHLLRHSFATHLLEQGTDIKIVKELMGHNNIKTTERYVHIADTFKSNVKSPLDDLLMEEGEV